MTKSVPQTTLDPRFSSPGAAARDWAEAQGVLETAPVYWLSTVRSDGRPHVTPLIALWLDEVLYFCTGAEERKAKNLEREPRVVVTTGCNALDSGFDVVVEGNAAPVRDAAILERLVESYAAKYGWTFTAGDGVLVGDGGPALVFGIAPITVFGFGKGEVYSQTRYAFARS